MPKRLEHFKPERLGKVKAITDEIDRLLHYRAVMVLRSLEAGATWGEVGEAQHISGEAARKHFDVQKRHYLNKAS